MLLGVDTGGTFTDFVVFNDESGEVLAFKVPSIPDDPAQAVLNGIRRMQEQHGIDASRIERFIFGTTVATNTVLELKGGKTALLTTKGTRDVIEIQRMWRHRLFDLHIKKPAPLVPRRYRFEVDERVGADGATVTEMSDASISALMPLLQEGNFESIAVCFLFSFLNPRHEEQIAAAIRNRLPDLPVSISSQVSPQFREYERGCTTVMNAYVMPKMWQLTRRLDEVLKASSCKSAVRIMQSNGGLMSIDQAQRFPVRTLLSGPAGGVVGAVSVAAVAGYPDIIAMDMGGTSLDISLARGGAVQLSSTGSIGDYPVQIPQVNVHTIGAGGGSIAHVVLGALKVGPQSAGADPGPACYGKGGVQPTSTDAGVALGYIDPDYFVGGEVTLDRAAACSAIDQHVGQSLQLATEEAASAIVRVQVANMVTGIRAVSVEQGLDPREFVLLPFGGAGGLYAGLIAQELGMNRIFIPVYPSVLSAFGMLMTDVKYTESITRLTAQEHATRENFDQLFASLQAPLQHVLENEKFSLENIHFNRSCDVRYQGQAYEINIPFNQDDTIEMLSDGFHGRHMELYGQNAISEPVEFVTFHIVATVEVPKVRLQSIASLNGTPTPKGIRSAWFDNWQETPLFEREDLASGTTVTGPAIVEDQGATTVIYPGHEVNIDGYGNMIIQVPKVSGI